MSFLKNAARGAAITLKNAARGAAITAGLVGLALCLGMAGALVEDLWATNSPATKAALALLGACLWGGFVYAVWKTRP